MSRICAYCQNKFCYTHANAFEHGCRDAHRRAEQKKWRQGIGAERVSGVAAPRALKPVERAHLQAKLKKKVCFWGCFWRGNDDC